MRALTCIGSGPTPAGWQRYACVARTTSQRGSGGSEWDPWHVAAPAPGQVPQIGRGRGRGRAGELILHHSSRACLFSKVYGLLRAAVSVHLPRRTFTCRFQKHWAGHPRRLRWLFTSAWDEDSILPMLKGSKVGAGSVQGALEGSNNGLQLSSELRVHGFILLCLAGEGRGAQDNDSCRALA